MKHNLIVNIFSAFLILVVFDVLLVIMSLGYRNMHIAHNRILQNGWGFESHLQNIS